MADKSKTFRHDGEIKLFAKTLTFEYREKQQIYEYY